MAKYTDARYPEKVNDIIDNDGKIKAEALPVDPEPTVVNDYEGLVDFINNLTDHYGEKLDVDQIFYFKDANPVDIEHTLTGFDAETIAYVTGLEVIDESNYYDFCFNLVGSVKAEDPKRTSDFHHFSGYIPVQIYLEEQSDTEMGGYTIHVYFGRPFDVVGGLVSGTLRIKTINKNVGE